MEPLILRQAVPADTPRILAIIRQAQAQMRALGSSQWQNGYPARPDIERDLARGAGYVLCRPAAGHREPVAAPERRADEVIAYAAVVFDGEPAYGRIDGCWLTDRPYVVVHRLAVADGEKRRGIATEFIRRIEAFAGARGIRSFRIDTNFDNRYMLRLLERRGFVLCGRIFYPDGGERLAFEKAI